LKYNTHSNSVYRHNRKDVFPLVDKPNAYPAPLMRDVLVGGGQSVLLRRMTSITQINMPYCISLQRWLRHLLAPAWETDAEGTTALMTAGTPADALIRTGYRRPVAPMPVLSPPSCQGPMPPVHVHRMPRNRPPRLELP